MVCGSPRPKRFKRRFVPAKDEADQSAPTRALASLPATSRVNLPRFYHSLRHLIDGPLKHSREPPVGSAKHRRRNRRESHFRFTPRDSFAELPPSGVAQSTRRNASRSVFSSELSCVPRIRLKNSIVSASVSKRPSCRY